jgi:aldehyde:ferredoxin oxidoreductase
MTEQLPGGYTGRILRVDLTTERVWVETMTAEECRYYLGAAGIGYKILWEEVPPEVTWDHPDNRLIMASGPLAGTPVWGTGSLNVVTRGAMTNGAVMTNAQGFFGSNLKYCGYDALVLQGQANRWVYVYINDDVVELRDASHLLGKDTWEMQDDLQAEHGLSGHQMSVYGVGPAGEKIVRYAIIEGDYGHVASKNGCGAVMGKKNVKCVAIVRGTKGVRVHDTAGLYQAADTIAHDLKQGTTYYFGTLGGPSTGLRSGTLPTLNYTTNIYPAPERADEWAPPTYRETFPHRGHQCSACGMKGHCHMMVVPEGPRKGELIDEPEAEGISGCGSQIGVVDPVEVSWLNTQVDKAGVDVNEWGWLCGWVMECYEKGYITKEQLGGLEMKWGDVEAANDLLQMVANREGFGDILAEGVKYAAEYVGGEAYDCAIFIHKGVSPRSHDHRGRWMEMLEGSVSGTSTIDTQSNVHPEEFGLPAAFDPFDPKMVGYHLGSMVGRLHFIDSLGICKFTANTYHEFICQALSASTGWDYTKEEAMAFWKRCAAMFRLFNLRNGIGPDSEKPSERYWSTPVDGPAAGTSAKENWDTMIATYYDTVGLDRASGRPFPETLQKLGLEHLIPEIWGIEEAKLGV